MIKRLAILTALLFALAGCQNDQETTQEGSEGSIPQESTAQFVEPTTPDAEPGSVIEYESESVEVIQYGSELPDTGGLSL